ncbi:hypothetical protein HGM15179_001504 [Zosterops borbonicus]|uniref:Fibroblast growth factor binding protein 3 n=1 Tax=Zosterops borbonicus TaxID=364589 RepID=A0A8K1LSQ9_9PASS|nr:hypothetical protein HGM15179_001504 [Zosterops borbonicus]
MRLPLALLLALAALGTGRGAEREAEEEARSGRFSTPQQQRCRWELRGAAGASELRLSCRAAGGELRSCAYRGEPRLCPAFAAHRRRFWRQILSRLRRRQHPCAPGAPLSARTCGPGRAPPEAQLRLLPQPGPEPQPSQSPAGTYCAQRWHSLCSFFLGFWEG